jgi:hypothetical protein
MGRRYLATSEIPPQEDSPQPIALPVECLALKIVTDRGDVFPLHAGRDLPLDGGGGKGIGLAAVDLFLQETHQSLSVSAPWMAYAVSVGSG